MNEKTGKKRILIIDDEQSFVEGVKLNLENMGEYEVMTETRGENALVAMHRFKPDIVFLDVVMPDIDGGEVMRRIKSDENLKDIPVVFLTAITRKDEVSSRKGVVGGHPFLAKPVSTQELIDYIRKNIGG